MMKKLCIFTALAAALLAAGCAREESPQPKPKMVTVGFTSELQTKTTLEGSTVNWEMGDQVGVAMYGGGKATFSVVSIDSGVALFQGEVEEAVYEKALEGTYPLEGILYPGTGANISHWWIFWQNMPIPREQTFIDGSFASGTNPSAAYNATFGGEAVFKNLAGLVSIKVTCPEQIVSATLTGNAGEELSGTYTVNLSDGKIDDSRTKAPTTDIVLSSSSAIDLSAGKTMVFVVKPNAFASGITLTVKAADGKEAVKSINRAFEVAPGSKANLPDLTLTTADFETPLDPSTIDLSGTYDVMAITPTVVKSSVNGAGPMQNTVYKTATKCDGSDANWPVPSGGQEYVVQYNRYGGQVLFFDLSSDKVPGLEGCYYLENIQDRNITTAGQITDNHSYYDSISGMIVFDFVRETNNSYGYLLSKQKDMSAYDLTGTYTVAAITPTASGTDVNAAGPMEGAVYETAVKCDGTDTNWPNKSNGQKYVVQYNRYGGQVMYFDLSSVPVIGKSGCYYLTNLQDREFTGTITENKSYYNTLDGSIVFDFLRESVHAYGYQLTK